MKRALLIILIIFNTILSSSVYAFCINNHIGIEEFRNKQKEYFIKKAGLTPEEANKFFPLYFELQDKKMEYNKEVWKNIRKGNNENTTDAEYANISENIIKTRITIDKLELEYLDKYKKILSPKKIYSIQRAEMRFHRELIKDSKEGKSKECK